MTMWIAGTLLAQIAPDAVSDVCGDPPGLVCRIVHDLTGRDTLARTIEWVVEKPLKILLILLIALLLNRLLRRIVRRFTTRLVTRYGDQVKAEQEQLVTGPLAAWRERVLAKTRLLSERAERGRQRAEALGTVLRSLISVIIFVVAALLVLGEFGVNLGPLLAGAGIAGVALGFGAQTLVRDFLSGIFMLAEDQYGVGDVVDLGDASGLVEEIRLRTTRLRDVNGTVWFVPNGEIRRVGNKSQQWARAVLDIPVAYGTDLDAATRAMKEAADSIWREQPEGATVLQEPEIWGVEDLGDSAIVLRLALKVEPGEQWATARLARRRIAEALDAAGIEIPFPQQSVWLRTPMAVGNPEGEALAG